MRAPPHRVASPSSLRELRHRENSYALFHHLIIRGAGSTGAKMITRRRFLAATAAAGAAALGGCAGTPVQGPAKYRVIDAHAHWYPREFVTLMENEGPANGARMGKDDAGNPV